MASGHREVIVGNVRLHAMIFRFFSPWMQPQGFSSGNGVFVLKKLDCPIPLTSGTISSMKNLTSLLASTVLLLSMFTARADQTADQTEILRLEKDGAAAIVAGDIKALGDFFSADWKIVDSEAVMMDREQLFKAMKAGLLKFSSYDESDLEVRVYGDAAVVIGTGKGKGEWKGEVFTTKERFTDVFVRQDGK